ncbi:hypothetical protein ABT56_20260 [Photobacterium aquae]|uniref:Uncharacterized protein n=1 Tax=Photobacterium aquae TaxID=1195763 RepID=A0A0J1JM95_9GAMM|nr:hypothetical protein [Photobacterium aquae]KLV03262.1 hypothetical protein ABT56_20260 [Photobacterium aquae]
MEKVKKPLNPIHQPCPDIFDGVNFDKTLTENSLSVVKSLRKRFGFTKNTASLNGCSDFRYSRPFQVQARRLMMFKGGIR